jgi:hypothetical protein
MAPDKWEAGDRHSRPPATDTFLKAHTTSHHTSGAQSFYRYAQGLRRRRAAANQLPPLVSGRRDPWHNPPPGPRGYEDAAQHLLEHGLMPAPNRRGLKAMRDRHAANRIAKAWGLAA